MKNIEELVQRERNAYFRQWRKKNKDKVRAINKRYWENRAKRNEEKRENKIDGR